jgi:hypothetical protein
MDVSLDHELTLIERSTDIHLNHPITAKWGTRNSRPARWELRMPHPSVPRKDGEGACEQVGENPSIASIGPRLGGSTHDYTSWICTERRRAPNMCAWHHRGQLKYCRCRLKLTPRTLADSAKKPCRSTHAPARLRGLHPRVRSRPHGIAQHPGGKSVPSTSISLCGVPTDTTAETRGLLSGTAIGVP